MSWSAPRSNSTLPFSAYAYSGLALPDHGELWSQSTTFELKTVDGGTYAVCGWVGKRMPYRFARAIYVTADRVEMHYAVTNRWARPAAVLWSAHPLLPLTKNTKLEFPEGARVRVWAQHGIELGGPGAEHRWPRAVAAGKNHDFRHPDLIARKYACKLFVDMERGARPWRRRTRDSKCRSTRRTSRTSGYGSIAVAGHRSREERATTISRSSRASGRPTR